MGKGSVWGRWARYASLSILTSCVSQPRVPGAHPVGVATLLATDKASQKPMSVEVWYPAAQKTRESHLLYGDVYPGFAARDAVPAQLPSLAPLIVIGHGLKSSRFDMAWLAEALAGDGMVVAAVDHPGTSADTWDSVEAVKMWHRAAQLSVVIDEMLSHDLFAKLVDPKRIGAVGHSAGGSAVLMLAGAQINPSLFAKRYPASAPVPEGIYADARVRAVIALAPGTGRVFDTAGVQKMQAPLLICSGTRDKETPEPFNAAFYHRALPTSIWHSLPDVGHYTFKPVCNIYGKLRSRGLCLDHFGVDRSAVHKQVIGWSRDFLQEHLR